MGKVELLAPAGSVETMYAAYAAGADAVYIGGSMFGARAYADNAQQEELLDAIDYAHLHGKKLYMTVNTLLKEDELEKELYDYILPYYEHGLDAAIVQDAGVMRCLKEWFPKLAIHASTQMTMSGELSAQKLKEYGVTRIVTPRELSLKEIEKIHESCDIEIESFVHGALCYCYSGQCLFSSIAGGRSGNRGKCAQPCRMAYSVEKQGKLIVNEKEGFVLSPKDLNTIEILPDIIDAGVYSLKIEGRMKKPEYTAGVVSIYRKYVDMYLQNGRKGYAVSSQDRQKLFSLFNRKGFTDGYFTRHNSKEMITFTKPDFRKEDTEYGRFLNENYIGTRLKEKINGKVRIFKDEPAILTVDCLHNGSTVHVKAEGPVVSAALKQPLTAESVRSRVDKIKDTDFVWDVLEVETDGESFCQLGAVNELRRNAIDQLRNMLLESYMNTALPRRNTAQYNRAESYKSAGPAAWSVQAETAGQLKAAEGCSWINRIYADSHITEPEKYSELTERVHADGKECFLVMPKVFRQENEAFFINNAEIIRKAGFDGYLVTVPEALFFVQKYLDGPAAGDHSLYAWNNTAASQWKDWGCSFLTLPLELNAGELGRLDAKDSEMIVYGRAPMMVSAQCIARSTSGCRKKEEGMVLIDRLNNRFPVRNYCRECYNIIYNNRPLMLGDSMKTIEGIAPGGKRIVFTVESPQETEAVLDIFAEIAAGREPSEKLPETTRGHFRRGVL